MTREEIEKEYAKLLKKYRHLRKLYAEHIVDTMWENVRIHWIETRHFLAIDRYRREIEIVKDSIRECKRRVVLIRSVTECGRYEDTNKIVEQLKEEFADEEVMAREFYKDLDAAEKLERKGIPTEEEMKARKKELRLNLEKIVPVQYGDMVRGTKSLWSKLMTALDHWNWKAFDKVIQCAKDLPRVEDMHGKDEDGIEWLRGEIAWLEDEYREKIHVCGMMLPPIYWMEEELRSGDLEGKQKRLKNKLEALGRIRDAYYLLAWSDVDVMQRTYLFTCQLSGTTHVKDIGKKTLTMKEGKRINLKRDPKNEHDKNAIGVFNSVDDQIGWVPQKDNEMLARLMDAGKFLYGEVETVKPVTKTGYLELSFKVYLCDI